MQPRVFLVEACVQALFSLARSLVPAAGCARVATDTEEGGGAGDWFDGDISPLVEECDEEVKDGRIVVREVDGLSLRLPESAE
jgi:hypothetical protein